MKQLVRLIAFALPLLFSLNAQAQNGSLLKLIPPDSTNTGTNNQAKEGSLLNLLGPDSTENAPAATDPYVSGTFRSSRLINALSPETIKAKHMDFRVTHRFGNVAGSGTANTFFGLDEASNIRIAFDYGITDRLMIGAGRSKVNGLLDGFVKYRLLRQTTNDKMPVTVTLMTDAGYNSKESPEKTINRISYVMEAVLARKFNDRVSLQLTPAFLHRNLVEFDDNNNLFALGAGGRYAFTKSIAVIVDYYYIFSKFQHDNSFSAPLGIGFEFDTRAGHVFHMDFTNAYGIIENQFLADTRDSWFDGHFKWGFNISRMFKF